MSVNDLPPAIAPSVADSASAPTQPPVAPDGRRPEDDPAKRTPGAPRPYTGMGNE